MAATDKRFAGSIPEVYDRFLVPLIFESYALDLSKRLAEADPRNVLETAAGTGALTRAIASRLPASARIVATDLNQPMVDHAAARQSRDGRIEWRQADALALPFKDRSFDVVACQFGVMFFPDKVQGYKEARRVLKPGGYFFFNVWDRISENEFADSVTEALAALFPDDPPRFLARTPHGYYDVDGIREELDAAGFKNIEVYKEPRFNGWTIGEVHVLDERIVPNARRDNFEVNHHYSNLIVQLAPLAAGVTQRCRTASVARNAAQIVRNVIAATTTRLKERRSFDRAELSRLKSTVHSASVRAKRIEDEATRQELEKALTRLAKKLTKITRKRGASAVALDEATALVSKLVTNREQAQKLIQHLPKLCE
jgi:ubiquinone/menaquinone biosynthesis C-methylase UbiE